MQSCLPPVHADLLALQLRAFITAADLVDGVDSDVYEDLITMLTATTRVFDGDHVSDDEDDKDEAYLPDDDLGLAPLYAVSTEVGIGWTTQEVRHMLHHLKERGIKSWLNEYVVNRGIPIPRLLAAFGIDLCPELQNKNTPTLLYFLEVALTRELHLREKLPNYNTIEDALQLIRQSRRIILLTGAGISVSCGIPDFRSRDGLYASLKDRGEYELDDPQQMFDIQYFKQNPAVKYPISFASQIYPSNFVPSPCHRFIKLLEDKDKLLRNYTQNIDTLETLAGVTRVIQCHGSFATASCIQCRRRVQGSEIEREIMIRKVPLCKSCNPPLPSPPAKKRGRKKSQGEWDTDDEDESDGPDYPPGIMKPDITFFGEKLSDDFDHALDGDRDQVDLLIVIGTSLKVAPVADLITHLPHSVPQILINRTPIRHINPDIVLLGNADTVIEYLCERLDWQLPPAIKRHANSWTENRSTHIWLFEGAEGGKWLDEQIELSKENNVTGTQLPLTGSSHVDLSSAAEEMIPDFKKQRVQ
ncbi:SIR2-domain-containing protein [Fistulina hepatica ATCC 64428]|uniref:SIR2-domain-containing protein n=1 Tax=Fistulina hepatica ATCC 64428 TaxID=1128425 RepID=A0A0D7AM85_9AGAR|nr:SIR2-domain-containing protein [Fistulina hepatica ATCC 64428]